MMRVYLDNAAATPLDSIVLDAMMPYFSVVYGNASAQHAMGREALKAIDIARGQIALAINALPNEIYFTSGGSESDNWAIRGVASAMRGKGRHIITSAIEHPAVLKTCKALEKEGYEITYLPVDAGGVVDITALKSSIREDTILISVMSANNEVGTVMPTSEIGAIARERGIYFHTDAVQAIGNVSIDVKAMNIDMLSISGHKVYGPKGVGVLYKRNNVKCDRIISGGEQERGYRAGTLNTPAIVGIGKSVEIAMRDKDVNCAYITALRDTLVDKVLSEISDVTYNGANKDKLPGIVNMSFNMVEGQSLLTRLDLCGIFASVGSACSAGSLQPSHVISAMGIPQDIARGTIRFSIGKHNTLEDINYTVEQLKDIVADLRKCTTLFHRIDNDGKLV
ncbi:MAG: IscS subfamily cysteine desulfurase [Clostridia bacterium]|nr:IscS subfamily cysteine desulfurase [Clostridia bacterium]